MFMLCTAPVQMNCQLDAKILCQRSMRLGVVQWCAVGVVVVAVFAEEALLLLDVLRPFRALLRQLLLRLVCLILFLKMKARVGVNVLHEARRSLQMQFKTELKKRRLELRVEWKAKKRSASVY